MIRSKNLMANLRRSSSKEVGGGGGGGRSKQPNEGFCRRHPKHSQSPGVCSLCLGEKLSQLSAQCNSISSRRRCNITTTVASCSSSSSSSSYYSSSSASSSSSPVHGYRFGNGGITEGKGSFSLFLFSTGKNMLTKSRSVALASRMRSKDHGDYKKKNKKKKIGLLSKLLHPKNTKRKDQEASAGLAHSRTMREILTTRVH